MSCVRDGTGCFSRGKCCRRNGQTYRSASPQAQTHIKEALAKLGDPTAGAPQPAPGTIAADLVELATVRLKLIFRSWVVNAFDWPFYTAAIAALLGLVPALLLPRRLAPQIEDEADAEDS